MLRRTKSVGKPDESISCRDLFVSGMLGGPAFSNIITAIETLIANGQRMGGWIVAAAGYGGKTNFTCDGVADQVQIQAAIAACYAKGGGTVWLTEGTFNTTAAIDLSYSNVRLRGLGPASIVKKNCNDYAIKAVGTSGTHLANVGIRDLTVTRDAADTNDKALIYYAYTQNALVVGCAIVDGIYKGIQFSNSSGIITNNLITGLTGVGIDLDGFTNPSRIVAGNTISNCWSSAFCVGIYVGAGSAACRVENNIITNMIGQRDGLVTGATDGIVVDGYTKGTIVSNNTVSDCYSGEHAPSSSRSAIRVTITEIDTIVASNTARNNGNLIDRGNCESVTDPCITGEAGNNESNALGARSNAHAHNGIYSFEHKKTSAGGGASSYIAFHDHSVATTTDLAGLVPGCSYTLSGWMFCPVPPIADWASVPIRFGYYNAGAWTDLIAQPTADNTWQSFSLTLAIPVTATSIRLFTTIASAEALNAVMYWDDIRLRPDGTSNEHLQQFSDAGTRTRQSGNSWNVPFGI